MSDMSDFSDDDLNEKYDSVNHMPPRKSKSFCFKSLFNDNENDSDRFDEPEHDSDKDPDFKCQYDENSDNDSDDNDRLMSDDDGCSVMSNMTDFQVTLDMLNASIGDTLDSGKKNFAEMIHESPTKTVSKFKMSKECEIIYGSALDNMWNKNMDVAIDQCTVIIKHYPSFYGSYFILAQIYEGRGDMKKANRLYYTAAMCDPKNISMWTSCIANTKHAEGLDKAIDIAKLALTRTANKELRKILIDLLVEGGYERDSFVKKLSMLHASPAETEENEIEKEVEDLFYMSEKFEAWNELNRASECLEILNKKYPSFLTDEKLLNLLKVLIKLKRFNKVIDVCKNISDLDVNLADMTDSSEMIRIDDSIDAEFRYEIIYAILMAIVHLKIPAAVKHRTFTEYLRQLAPFATQSFNILKRLLDYGYHEMVMENAQFFLDTVDEKWPLLKLIGKCQEKLNLFEEALITYDYIISEINGKDASTWELKANLLYNLGREQDAINVLAESQNFIHDLSEDKNSGRLTNRPKPTKTSAQLLCRLCQLLEKENRTQEYIKIAWKYLFIDSYEYFKVNKIKLSCEDISTVADNFQEITNSLWICTLHTTTGKHTEKGVTFNSSHSKSPYETEAWNVMESLLDLFLQSEEENMKYIEVLSQWGLVLQKFVGWNATRCGKLSAIYMSTALINRLKDVGLRTQSSSKMIMYEFRSWKEKFGDKVGYWNTYNLLCHLTRNSNNRYILRCMRQTKGKHFLELLNSGYVVSNNTKLSTVVNRKVHSEYPDNPQVCLQLAITFVNGALSRNCRATSKPINLAIDFMKKYRELRGDCQETWYNTARFYHRINFRNDAIACYNECLAKPPSGNTVREKEMADLSQLAAFNLVSIYKESNNREMVAHITQKHLIK